MRRAGILAVVLVCCGYPAIAAEIDLGQGRLAHKGEWAVLPISAKNNSTRSIEWLTVECGFFQNAELLAIGMNNTRNIKPNETAYLEVSASSAESADRAECRVKVAE